MTTREDAVFTKLAVIQNQMQQVEKQLQSLTKILIEDGQYSITNRLTVVETKLIQADRNREEIENQKVTIRAAFISSFIGLASSIAVVLLEIFWKR